MIGRLPQIRSEAEEREAVAAEALSWLRTPYQHRQRLKGVACDCAGLPLEVYASVGIIPVTDVGNYSHQWHLHQSREIYLDWVRQFGREIDPNAARRGDFIVFRFGRTYSHGAIVLDPPLLIHAYAKSGMVLTDSLQTCAQLNDAKRKAFTFWGDES
jgi:cell wall-associated NlpC family hydrolase